MKEETENELKNVLGRMQYNGGQQITFSQAKEDEEVRKRVVDRPKERQEEKVSISYSKHGMTKRIGKLNFISDHFRHARPPSTDLIEEEEEEKSQSSFAISTPMNMSLINREKADFVRLDSTIVNDDENDEIKNPVENDFAPAVESLSSESEEDNKTVVMLKPTPDNEFPSKPEKHKPSENKTLTKLEPVEVNPSKTSPKENDKLVKKQPEKFTQKQPKPETDYKVNSKTENLRKNDSKVKISEKKTPTKSLQAKEPDIKLVSSIKQKPNKSVKTRPATKSAIKTQPDTSKPRKLETKSTVGSILGNFFGMSKSVKEMPKSPVIKKTTPKKPSLMELARKPTVVDEKYKSSELKEIEEDRDALLALFEFYGNENTLESHQLRHLLDTLGDNFTDIEFDDLTSKTAVNGKFEFNKLYDFVQK